MATDFRKRYSFEQRKGEAERIKAKYPNRIPVIVEKQPGSDIQDIEKRKYLIPVDITVAHFLTVIRKRIKLKPKEAIFLFINGNIPPTSELMSNIYAKEKDLDLFLYVYFCGENVYG
jgi:GABA(A) receptor-associated protein